MDATGNTAEAWTKAKDQSLLPARWWDFVKSTAGAPGLTKLRPRDIRTELGLPPQVYNAIREKGTVRIENGHIGIENGAGPLTANDLVAQWLVYLHDEASHAASYLAQEGFQEAVTKDSSLRAAIDKEIAEQRREYEEKTPGLTAEQRKAAAPWLYEDNNKYFRPQLIVHGPDDAQLVFTPTPELRQLQLQQALFVGTVAAGAHDQVKQLARLPGSSFTPPRTVEESIRWFELFGTTEPLKLVRPNQSTLATGSESSNSDLAIVVPAGTFLKGAGEAAWLFFVKAGGEIAVNAAIAVAAEKVAEQYGPAAGAAVPFVPVIVGLATRRAIRTPALRKAAIQLWKDDAGAITIDRAAWKKFWQSNAGKYTGAGGYARAFKDFKASLTTLTPKFRSDLESHLALRDSTVARIKGIGGAHNLEEFNKAALAEGIKITKRTPHPTVPGVEKIEYQIPSLDIAGKPTGGFKAKLYEKTVYDPKVITDAQMIQWGKEAAQDAAARGALTREWTGTAKNGVKFRGYLDDAGEVRSFFPDI